MNFVECTAGVDVYPLTDLAWILQHKNVEDLAVDLIIH